MEPLHYAVANIHPKLPCIDPKNMPSSIIEDVVIHIFIFIFHWVVYSVFVHTYLRFYVFIKAAILESST